jgi:hypothetical protein
MVRKEQPDNNGNCDGNLIKEAIRRGEIMAVSVKTMPTIRGEAAKRIIDKLENPANQAPVLDKCKKLKEAFKEK